MSPNKFITGLGEIFSRQLLSPKLLMSPSLRVGQQWLDEVARADRPVVNVRARTLTALVLDLAAPALVDRGLSYASGEQLEVLTARAFAGINATGAGYLTRLKPSPGIISSLTQSLRELRLAGIEPRSLSSSAFRSTEKAAELRELLTAFDRALAASRLVDYPAVLTLALTAAPSVEPLLLMPADLVAKLSPRERELWERVPESRRKVIGVDGEADGGDNDAGLLRYINKPEKAPKPVGDGSVEIFRAIGEVNEVREVFRRCLAQGIPFDDVEILHTQYDGYVPLIAETAALLAEPGAEFPVTFSEGLPARTRRPGRALAALMEWIGRDCSQPVLVRMVQDGLLRFAAHDAGISFTRIAAILRTVPVAIGRDRWLPALDESVKAARHSPADEDDDGRERAKRLEVFSELRRVVGVLLELTAPGPQARRLRGAITFLKDHARGASVADESARAQLIAAIAEMADAIGDLPVPGFNPDVWLAELPASVRIGGLGPRPGRIFVSPLRGGGHSGRGHTFIIGLDDARFPGGATEDPILLDREREGLSPHLAQPLPQAAERAGQANRDLAALFARLRGRVTLSYSCRDVADDRECFPTPALISAGRIKSGGENTTLKLFLDKVAKLPVSFAPEDADHCLSMAEWWLCNLTAGPVREAVALVGRNFPHLGQGEIARQARASSRFTEYDGYVPEAGAKLFAPGSNVVFSSTKLEQLGRYPLDFFFRHVLRVKPPEEYSHDPSVWLDALARGSLLHSVFHDFLIRFAEGKRPPEYERDWPRLEKLLEGALETKAAELPPGNPAVVARERREIVLAAQIFLREEEEHWSRSRPCFLEACIGTGQDSTVTAIDCPEPVELKLPGGRAILVRGKIDRVDRLDGPGACFAIWDYKTGRSNYYQKQTPFNQGRYVQNSLYCLMVQARLDTIEPGGRVQQFGYFFPTGREHGNRVAWTIEQLADGGKIIADLCELAARGAFCASEKPADAVFSDCTLALGDLKQRAAEVEAKFADPANEALEPLRRLRAPKEKKK